MLGKSEGDKGIFSSFMRCASVVVLFCFLRWFIVAASRRQIPFDSSIF